jgi:tungstate transport system substrate-binding protein
VRAVLAASLVLLLAACTTAPQQTAKPAAEPAAKAPSELVLASTTSTQDSGLFDVLIPAFEKADPAYKVKVIAVGTGEALKLGKTKDADVLLVHAKAQELQFMADGYGVKRSDVMYNDFLIVGPKDDPAGVKAAKDTTAAMLAIKKSGEAGKALFVSRGDKSGTETKELGLWKLAGVTPTPTPSADKWYLQTGQGMGETLKVTSEKKTAYTLVDRATYLSMKGNLDLIVVREGDKGLLNQYGVIVVKDAKNLAGAEAFYNWIISPEGQKVVGDYGVAKYGQQLFVPNAPK